MKQNLTYQQFTKEYGDDEKGEFNWDKFISDLSPLLAVAEQKEFYQFADVIQPSHNKKVANKTIGNDNYFTQYYAKPSIRLVKLGVNDSYFLDILLKDENSEGYHYMSTEYREDFLNFEQALGTFKFSMLGWDAYHTPISIEPFPALKDFSTNPWSNKLSFWRGISAIKVIIDFAAPNQFMNWTTNPFTQ